MFWIHRCTQRNRVFIHSHVTSAMRFYYIFGTKLNWFQLIYFVLEWKYMLFYFFKLLSKKFQKCRFSLKFSHAKRQKYEKRIAISTAFVNHVLLLPEAEPNELAAQTVSKREKQQFFCASNKYTRTRTHSHMHIQRDEERDTRTQANAKCVHRDCQRMRVHNATKWKLLEWRGRKNERNVCPAIVCDWVCVRAAAPTAAAYIPTSLCTFPSQSSQ